MNVLSGFLVSRSVCKGEHDHAGVFLSELISRMEKAHQLCSLSVSPELLVS